MKDLEKQIEEAAEKYDSSLYGRYKVHFITGAKSEAAKQYWQQGMYSERETEILCLRAMRDALRYINGKLPNFDQDTWFEQNKKK